MTTVGSATAANVLSQTTGSNSAAGQTALADYDDFLTLLTSQLRNQDPLNPQDSTEFVEQIATFTTVEQQIAANDRLDQLIALASGNQLSQLAQWVGREVEADSTTINYQGGEITVDMPDSGGADISELVIKNHNGSELARVKAPVEGGSVTWDGTLTAGGKADPGSYRMEYSFTTLTADGPKVSSYSPPTVGVVIEARVTESGATELVLEGGLVVVSPDDVTTVRQPTAEADPAPDEETGAEEDDSVVDDVVDAAESAADAVADAVTGS